LWCIHNAIEMEKRGLATTTVCTPNFASLVRETAEAEGFPTIALITIPHPIAENDVNLIRQKADNAIEKLIQIITT